MPLSVKNFGNDSFAGFQGAVNFTGLRTGKINYLPLMQEVSEKYLDGIYEKLSKKVAPDFIQISGDENLYKKANSFLDSLKYPFVKMPLELLNTFANKFHIESLQNSKTLVKFRKAGENELCERALRGLLQNGDTFLDGAAKTAKGEFKLEVIEKLLRKGGYNPELKSVCSKVADEFYRLFDSNLAPDKAKYNTAHERTVARGISGAAAAFIMGNDYYNKSIRNGKTDLEAKEEAKSKKKQELLECGQEALSQYFMLGAFSSFVNNSSFGAPILNTLLSLVFRVTSRLSTGKPLVRMKANENDSKTQNHFSINNYVESVSDDEVAKYEANTQGLLGKDENKHILSFKNIAIACAISIGCGFAFRNIKDTKIFKNVMESVMNFKPIKTLSGKFKEATVSKLYASKEEMNTFYKALSDCKYTNMKKHYSRMLDKVQKNPNGTFDCGKLFIGEYEKFAKIPHTNIEISKKELYTLPLAPFKIIKEIAIYPYKLVSSVLEGLGVIRKAKYSKPKNDYNLVNTILDFKKQAEKFDGDTTSPEFLEHYKKHIEKNWCSALNRETKSNVNNCNIGKFTALLGVLASIYFASTDDYNSTLRQTGDVEKANKDARLRGVNKIIRTAVQCVFLSLNNLFKISYSKSLFGAGVVTMGCTVLTDGVSRMLSGMPFRKMNQEQLEQYAKNKQEGVLKKYYNFLDKLTD